MSQDDEGLIYVYILAPITVMVAVGVFTYICIQSKRLKEEMIRNGQLITIMPTFVTPSNTWQQTSPPAGQHFQNRIPPIEITSIHTEQLPRTPPVYSPKGLPPPPPYTR